MLAISNLTLLLTSFPIIEPDLLVGPHADQICAVRTKGNSIDVSLVLPQTRVELEWRTMKESQTGIITPCCRSQWSLLSDAYAVDLRTVSAYLPDRIATIRSDAVTILLFTITHCYYALAVSIPCQIIDASTDYRIFALCSTFADTIPDMDCARDVTTSHIIAGWRKTGNCCSSGVGSVLGRLGGVIN